MPAALLVSAAPEGDPSVKHVVVIHYHEIQLKKNNRSWFENRLRLHLEALLQGLPHGGIQRNAGRMMLALDPDSPRGEIARRLKTAFGISNFAFACAVKADLENIQRTLSELLAGRSFRSFKIDTRRGTKEFQLNSQQVNEILGTYVREKTGATVRLEDPDLTCYIELVSGTAFLYFQKIQGGGGLPPRSGGRLMGLLSGGIDSPVAAFRMIRRGCHVAFVHFHSFPHTTRESQEKVRRLVQVLSRYQLASRLYMVPFADLQREIVAYSPPNLRVLLYRRFMVRLAEALAPREKALALVTGDSLGQVASQTLENLRAVSEVAQLPVFRPLIGEDKEDIIRIARQIGTYETSIIPDQDCCSMFVPKHPETMAKPGQLVNAEAALDVERLVRAALDCTHRETIQPDFDAHRHLPREQAVL